MIDGLVINILKSHPDERGFFAEIIKVTDPFFREGFAQLSHSFMLDGVVKAWHVHKTQIDWWYCVSGTILCALYDTRASSPTYKAIQEITLGEKGKRAVLKIPPGVAHGLKVISGPANLVYVTSRLYDRKEEGRIPYNDPEIGYDWIQGKAITNKKIT
jgi:dTDP-4-dehydrorhamnose 3,5-epimerase